MQEAAATRILRSWSFNLVEKLAWTPSWWKLTKYKYPCSYFEDFDWCINWPFFYFGLCNYGYCPNILLHEKLKCCFIMQFPIDLEQHDRRDQLKRSGLGKVRNHLEATILFSFVFWSILDWFLMLFPHKFYGQVIMFLSKSDEETTSNRKLAKDLVDKWVMFWFKLLFFIC